MDKPNGRASQTTNTKQENTRLYSVAVKSLYGEKHGFQKRGLANSKKTVTRRHAMACPNDGNNNNRKDKMQNTYESRCNANKRKNKIGCSGSLRRKNVEAVCKTWNECRAVKRCVSAKEPKRNNGRGLRSAEYRWCVDGFRSEIGGRVRAVRRRDSPAPGAHDRHRCARTHRPDHGKETVKSCKVQRQWR
ncbi:unnamed protein product [Macrosiphum euphorbiae]|uniref:Uncharacterized protein n=1 Tax=Macrosiphum euphorbiae TaxID=13131 RepID=A0AAV0W9K0_9HEMI|nr:unnamed protein product [Macrosiphum euphorbiae]